MYVNTSEFLEENRMSGTDFKIGNYNRQQVDWDNGWAILTSPKLFAAKFNLTVSGAYRQVTESDIRQMSHCRLIGRYGFYTREDLETVRSILRYEQLREHASRKKRDSELVHAA
jgi:hypothetical protein